MGALSRLQGVLLPFFPFCGAGSYQILAKSGSIRYGEANNKKEDLRHMARRKKSTTKSTTAKTTTKAASTTTAATMSTAPKTVLTTAAKAAAAATTPTPGVVAAAKPVIAAPMMKKKDLMDRVVERSGMKKKDVKPAVEAALAVIGEALAAGEEMNIQPLGKIMVNREKDRPNGKVIICKVRQPKPPLAAQPSPVVDAAE
jgi:DNA-binding protein HU-alpha